MEFVVLVVGLKEVKTSDVGILDGIERLVGWILCLWCKCIGKIGGIGRCCGDGKELVIYTECLDTVERVGFYLLLGFLSSSVT